MLVGIFVWFIVEEFVIYISLDFIEQEYCDWQGSYCDFFEKVIVYFVSNCVCNVLIVDIYVQNCECYGQIIIFVDCWY